MKFSYSFFNFLSCLFLICFAVVLSSCSTHQPRTGAAFQADAQKHIHLEEEKNNSLPPLIENLPPKIKTYPRFNVAVKNANVREVLLALAESAQVNMDIAPGVQGNISLNAIEQTLPQILERLALQVNLRYKEGENYFLIEPDLPYLKHYAVNYLNMQRKVEGRVASNTQIVTNTQVTQNGAVLDSSNTDNSNISRTHIDNRSENDFWVSLEKNIRLLLKDSEQADSNVMIHSESGTLSIRATQKQHQRIAELIEKIGISAQRQVLIEATIVEVLLNNAYKQGVDWSHLAGRSALSFIGNTLKTSSNLTYSRAQDTQLILSLLETFGTTRVLSSPRLAVMNNQTALLKVVENYVYFNVKADTVSTANVGTSTTYTTTPQTVSVGLVMGVTPQISDNDVVMLNVRPTITQIGREVADPNPDLRAQGIENLLPVIRTREIESVLRVKSGHTAILGGLMEDKIMHNRAQVPYLSKLPILGEILTNRQEEKQKSELIIFLRPVVMNAQPNSPMLPDADFFQTAEHNVH